MNIYDILEAKEGAYKNKIEALLVDIINEIHTVGPINLSLLEKLAYIKKFHFDIFEKYENKIVYLLGLFYKTNQPKSLLEKIYEIYAKGIEDKYQNRFTPVQANAYANIDNNTYFSFSAPTSAGKSYLFRSLIENCEGDIVIVVPSRALIAEYTLKVLDIVGKEVLVLQFIENVNILHTKRKVFIITPERGAELFKVVKELNVKLFLFDEAQISEEPVRGMRFDSFVRRVDRILPEAKKVFAHPFIRNPEAQLKKHAFSVSSSYANYKQNSVGKIYISVSRNRKDFQYFSPFDDKVHKANIKLSNDIVKDILLNDGTLLVYTSKNKIYKGKHLEEFHEYIDLCPKVMDLEALAIIDELREFIGADKKKVEKYSSMIDLMEKGIVIHHGSIPLSARTLIERFINNKYAKICFSTSTLVQGINMPLDIVWIDNFKFEGDEEEKELKLKNLIGRAGRSIDNKNSFDYGYVIVGKEHISTFNTRIKGEVELKETSLLDEKLKDIDEDLKDIVEAIQKNEFDDEMQLTKTQVERINKSTIDKDIAFILDNLIVDGKPITAGRYNETKNSIRTKIKKSFNRIYISHLKRKKLTKAEASVLSASIPIILWRIQGKSFSQIISLRYLFVANLEEQRIINAKEKNGEITKEQAIRLKSQIPLRYSQIASVLPNKKAKALPLFDKGALLKDFSYDRLVYDTYDYIDKVVSQSLSQPLSAAFQIYYEKTGDNRALAMKNYIKYGTNDDVEIWLQKYGFGFEDIEWIKEYVVCIDEKEIVFKPDVKLLPKHKFSKIERYFYDREI